MKTLQKVGGISALVCAGTYILALGLLTTHWYDLPPDVMVQSMIHTAQHGW